MQSASWRQLTRRTFTFECHEELIKPIGLDSLSKTNMAALLILYYTESELPILRRITRIYARIRDAGVL